ncbi:MAG: hypothetical protein WBD20_06065 [Pirellulaceae bacterium]
MTTSVHRFTKAKTFTSLALIGAAVILSTGCMTAPFHGQSVNSTNATIPASGFVTGPFELVQLQYFNNTTQRWNSLVTTNASGPSDSLEWSNTTWYPWKVNFRVPQNGWKKYKDFSYTARIRAVREGGQLYTFDEYFWNCFDPNGDLGDLWDECGHGTEVTIVMNP